ncbi:MAG: sulfatase-like hydrolase/transferase [Rikenellaceae bacterium]
MTNRSAFLLATIGCCALSTEAFSAKKSERPNVLFIFVDDMTFNGLNALGRSDVISPNFDKLIAEGTRFSNVYNMGGWNGAVSQASRSQLFTGRYLWNSQRCEENQYEKNLNTRTTWPAVMKDAGYDTYMTGKWHVYHVDPKQVFDEVGTVRPGMPDVNLHNYPNAYNRPLSRDNDTWSASAQDGSGYWLGGKHWSEVQADQCIGAIEAGAKSDNPFFIYCAFNAPHDPRQSPQRYLDMYDVDKITVPTSFQPLHPLMEEMDSGVDLRDEALAPFPRTEYAVQKHLQEYYGIITHLDDQIGRVIKSLKKSGQYDNTLIVFTADNGLAMGRHGLIGKQNMYEHSMKIPLLFIGDGIAKGESRDQMLYMQDLVPTIYDIVGIERPKDMNFISQIDALKDSNSKCKRPYIYGAYIYSQRMIRNDRYKLIFIPAGQHVLLFDLENDPEEMNNLYGDAKYDDVVMELAKNYLKEAKKSGDELLLTPYYFDLFSKAKAK